MKNSEKRGVSKPGMVLVCLGLMICAAALVMLRATAPLSQYAVTMPYGQNALAEAQKQWDAVKADVGAPGASLYVCARGQNVSSKGGETVSGLLYGVERPFFTAHPLELLSGRLFDPAEHADGSRVIAVNQITAFRLFPGTDAEGRTVALGGAEYKVVGVVKGNATVGDGSEFAFYVPYKTLAATPPNSAICVVDCVSSSAGVARSLKSAAEIALGDGCFYDLSKESMRQSMLARLVLAAFGFAALLRLLAVLNAFIHAVVVRYQREMSKKYLRDMLGGIFLRLLAVLACCAALAGFMYLLVRMLIEPMTVFPEWIPDVFVEWKSVWERVSALIVSFSRPVMVNTREMAELLLKGLFLRWGLMMLLTGGVLCAVRLPARYKAEPSETQDH